MKVRLHNNQSDSANATDSTIKMLGGGTHALKRDPDGNILFDQDGYAELETSNPGFVRFALVRQGYVAEVL